MNCPHCNVPRHAWGRIWRKRAAFWIARLRCPRCGSEERHAATLPERAVVGGALRG